MPMIRFNITRAFLLILPVTAVLILLCSCTLAPEIINKTEKLVSVKTARDTEQIKITQEATPITPEMKFIVPVNYEVSSFETVHTIRETRRTTQSWLGFGGSVLGLLYFAANPAPDPASYAESKYNSLSDDRLMARQIGLGITLAGLAVGFFSPKDVSIFNQPTGKITIVKNKSESQVKNFSVWAQCDNLRKEKIQSGFVTDQSEGTINFREILSKSITRRDKLPYEVTLSVDLENGVSESLAMPIAEAIDFISAKEIDWSVGQLQAGKKPVAAVNQISDQSIKAGKEITVNLELENKGNETIYQMAAYLNSELELWDNSQNKILLFGKMAPGGKVTRSFSVLIPPDIKLDMMPLKISFQELNGHMPKPINLIIYIDK